MYLIHIVERRKLSISSDSEIPVPKPKPRAQPRPPPVPVAASSNNAQPPKRKRGRPRKYPRPDEQPKVETAPEPAPSQSQWEHSVDSCRLTVLKFDLVYKLEDYLPRSILYPGWLDIKENWVNTIQNAESAAPIAKGVAQLESYISKHIPSI